MHCDLHWGGVLRNRQCVHSLLIQCFVSCGSTNYTALWVTGYFGDLSAVLVVDELHRQAVDRRCFKRPSRLGNWSVCTPPSRSLVEPHLHLSQIIVLSLYCPQAAIVKESSILRHKACLLSQFNNWQCQSLQPTAGVSSNILDRLSASFFQLHVAGNRTYSSRVKHVALRCFFIQDVDAPTPVSVDCPTVEWVDI